MDTPTLEDFLQRALVWPDPNSDSGWINLHWRMHDRKGITGGQAFKTLQDTVGFIQWANSRGKGKVADLYYCTSLQAEHGPPKPNGRYSALRSIDNAVASRLLFADVDKYESKGAAILAVKLFCEQSQSPFPTALVDSGGGIHAYWILPEALQKDDWLELACRFDGLLHQYGLKHDNISTDMARILRPPETFNYKRMAAGIPPQPVVLKLLNGNVDLASWKSLRAAKPTAPLPEAKSGDVAVAIEHLFLNPAEISKGPPAFFRGKIPLAEQIGAGEVDAAPVLKLCPMFTEALRTGGKEIHQPVWHQQALGCTFLVDGRHWFHQLGRNHPTYSRESTDDMYDRKIRDRASKGLGFPSCRQFEADGSVQCSTCPLRGQITSPLNITSALLAKPEPAAVKEALFATPPPDNRIPLPDDFEYDDKGYIWAWIGTGKNKIKKQLFWSFVRHIEPYIEAKGNAIGMTTLVASASGTEREIRIPAAAFDGTGQDIISVLNQGGCATMGNPGPVSQLFMTFRGRMQADKQLARAVPYGWEYAERKEGEDQGHPIGFAYNGTVYEPDGKTRPAYGGDDLLKETYSVNGKPDPWVRAVRTIIRMGSPGLQVTVLSAFAAPLMVFTGQPCTVVMVRGQSGGSKSTASAVACAVWARPRTAMLKPSSSKLATMRRMGRVRHLPTFWDDIRNEQFETVKDTLMEITQGGEGLKLDQNREEREQGVWDNMLLTTSNNSLVEYLESISKNDGAALVRCFEFEVPKIKRGDEAYEDPVALGNLIAQLDHHCGHAGREYAMILGADPQGLQRMYAGIAENLMNLVEPFQPHERFWLAAAASILMAAHLANQLPIMKNNGVQFSVDDVKEFLIKIFLELRQRHGDANFHADTSRYAKNYLNAFINNWAGPRNEVVWTTELPSRPGRPGLTGPIWPVGDEARRMKVVSLRWIPSLRKVRISKAALDKFLEEEGVSRDRVREGLVRYYGAKVFRGRMATGLANIAAQGLEQVYEIDVKPGSWLDTMLQQHATSDDAQKIVPIQPGQNPRQQATHPQPEHTDPEDAKGAS